jgi:ABC-type multidrug transport system fused ATPase/permease subunit
MSVGLLDLLTILILGLFSYVGSAYLGISKLTDSLEGVLSGLRLSSNDLGRTLSYLILTSVLLILFKSIVALFILKKTFLFLSNQNAKISRKIARQFMNSSFELISNRTSQEATYAIGRGLHISEILGNATVVISEITMLFLLLGIVVAVEPILGITILLYFVIVSYLSQKKLGLWMRTNSQEFSESNVKGDQILQEGIALYKELFVANKLDAVVDHFTFMRMRVANATANIQLINYIPKFTFESALVIGACLVGLQSTLVGSTQSAITSLVLFFAAGSRILPSLLRLQSATNSIQSFSGASEISFNLLNDMAVAPSKRDVSHRTPFITEQLFDSTVRMENVNYGYDDKGHFSIKNVTLDIPAGGSLAVVGKTGSGKSTLVNLLLGILEPNSGRIAISGVPPASAIMHWPGLLGYVPQDVAFVNGTVRDNVAIGLELNNIDDEQIWKCLENVQLNSMFIQSPQGLDTLIGERGIKLSGGQRQRLGIARALYHNPKLLVLDEATSALDAETEKAISETIANLTHKLTLVIVAHRIATVQTVDQVAYLENGQIQALGTFNEVREAVPDFERQAMLMGL